MSHHVASFDHAASGRSSGACPQARASRRTLQDTLQQLLTQLRGSEGVLNQHHGEIAGALAELDPVHHSLGYLFLL